MKAPADIVYIRAIDLRPLYIDFDGTYHLVTRILRQDYGDILKKYTGYELRIGDLAEIQTPNRMVKIEVSYETQLTDEPKLAEIGYSFA